MGEGKNGLNSWRLALEFCGHIIAAAIVFALIALVAFALKVFIEWADSWARPPEWMLDTLRFVEHGIFVVDVITFVLYVGTTTWNFSKALRSLLK